MTEASAPRVMMVCLGNICRSPTAEAVLRKRAHERGVAVRVESSGTGGHHAGEGAHRGTRSVGRERGYDLSGHVAKQASVCLWRRCPQFDPARADEFDYIIAMDRENLSDLRSVLPRAQHAKLSLLCSYAPELGRDSVPGATQCLPHSADPWYTGRFHEVVDICEAAVDGLLTTLARPQP